MIKEGSRVRVTRTDEGDELYYHVGAEGIVEGMNGNLVFVTFDKGEYDKGPGNWCVLKKDLEEV